MSKHKCKSKSELKFKVEGNLCGKDIYRFFRYLVTLLVTQIPIFIMQVV